jgi:hypothetical protein
MSARLEAHQRCSCPLSRRWLQILIASALMPSAADVYGHPLPLGFTSASSGWEASIDDVNWIPAYHGYPNPYTKPVLVDPMGNISAENLEPAMIWYWNESYPPNGQSGPDTVYFRYQFDIAVDPSGLYGIWVAADDWMQVKLNGNLLGNYYLDSFKDQTTNQPVPELLEVLPSGLLNGLNTIEIEAHDGGPLSYDRFFEWAYIDSVHNQSYVPFIEFVSPTSPNSIPEPASFALIVVGLSGLAGIRHHQRKRI